MPTIYRGRELIMFVNARRNLITVDDHSPLCILAGWLVHVRSPNKLGELRARHHPHECRWVLHTLAPAEREAARNTDTNNSTNYLVDLARNLKLAM